jgi:hypothetical protein
MECRERWGRRRGPNGAWAIFYHGAPPPSNFAALANPRESYYTVLRLQTRGPEVGVG